MLILQHSVTTAQQASTTSANSAFSFAVYGDSRSMMYLPYKSDQEADARQVIAEMFELVFPPNIAMEVAKKDVKLIYDPATHELSEMVMPFMTKSEVTTVTFDKGWATKASVQDVKLLPGVHRTMFELQGGEWVASEVAKSVKTGRAKFVLHTGDLVWWGSQGSKPSDNPYWKLVNDDIAKQMPPPDDQMLAAGLGRVASSPLWAITKCGTTKTSKFC